MKILKTLFVASFYLTMGLTQKDLRIPPSITREPPRNRIYRAGESVTLDCKGKGVPAVTYEWKKNNITLDQTLRNIKRGSDGTITIQPATSRDEGFYQCFARNRYGTALSITAHVQMAFLDSTSGTPNIVLNRTVTAGQPFNITCNPRKSFPKATFSWKIVNSTEDKRPIALQLTNRIQIAENGKLVFGYALPKDGLDGKLYRCSTYNPYLRIEEGGNYTRLTVISQTVSPFPPTLGFSSKSPIVAVRGRNVTMTCLFNGNPEPTHIWLPPENAHPTGRYNLSDYNTTLTIEDVTASDEGKYTCIATSSLGNNSKDFNINVEAEPVFPTLNDGPYDVNVIEDESFTFRCNPVAKPVAKIVWLQNGNELDPNNPPERFVFSNDLKNLTIRDVCRDCVDRERKTDLMVIQCNASNVHGYAFGQGYLNVFDTYCDYEFDEKRSILWNRTLAGNEIFQLCPVNTTGLCSRKCVLNSNGVPVWSPPNYNGCFDKEFYDLLERVNNVTADAFKNQTVIVKIASELSAVTNTSEGLSPGNLNASVMLINRLADLRRDRTVSTDATEIKSIVEATSNVLQTNNSVAWKELEYVEKTVATTILSSVDVYGRSLSALNTTKYSTEKGDNMVLEAWSWEKSNLPVQLKFPSQPVWDENSGDEISISMESLQSSISKDGRPTLTVWGSYYRTVNNYLPGNEYIDFINSKVLSFSIGGLKTKEKKLKRPVSITLQHNQEEGLRYRRTCAFWNFDRGEWDTIGCSVTSTNLTHTICSCDHLTNFAILMSLKPSYDKALSLLSTICCSISVVSLILTIITYAVTWKQSKSAQATVLLNLCVALIIAYVIFMAGGDKIDSKGGCIAVAALLHYFFLAVFFIMLAEGVELLLYIIFVFHVRRTRETTMLLAAAWVLPLIIVAVSLGSRKLQGYGNGHACWLSVKNGLIWAFVGPVLFIITVNLVILIIVLRWMSQRSAFIANNEKKRNEIKATLWNLSVTCPVLGLGWLFGILTLVFDYTFLQYLFVIVNSLQGLFIFIFHALFHNKKMNEKISSVYSNSIGRCRKSDYSVSTQMTSAPEQPSKKTDKEGFVPRAVKYYEEIARDDNLQNSGKRLTGIEYSDTLESAQ